MKCILTWRGRVEVDDHSESASSLFSSSTSLQIQHFHFHHNFCHTTLMYSTRAWFISVDPCHHTLGFKVQRCFYPVTQYFQINWIQTSWCQLLQSPENPDLVVHQVPFRSLPKRLSIKDHPCVQKLYFGINSKQLFTPSIFSWSQRNNINNNQQSRDQKWIGSNSK